MRNILISCLISFSLGFGIEYKTEVSGIGDDELLKEVLKRSELVQLQSRPPSSITALVYRVKSDIPNLVQVLRAYGYYDSWISYDIQEEKDLVSLTLHCHTGPRYLLGSYEILKSPCNEETPFSSRAVSQRKLGIKLHRPITSKEIINAELRILEALAACGFPLAKVEKRDVAVDMREKTINVTECIEEGPLCRFGGLTIVGLRSVKPDYILKRIPFREGEIYRSSLLEQTQQQFIATDLFSSVIVTHAEELDQEGLLPMKIHLTEAHHKTIGVGVSYSTIDGFGVTFSWVHRNLRGLGEKLSVDVDLSQKIYQGVIAYTKPDFLKKGQNFILEADASREHITPYLAFTYRAESRVDRTFSKRLYGSFGVKGEYIDIKDSISNGTFTLVGGPLYVRYSTANDLLNPTTGLTTSYLFTPYASVGNNKALFFQQILTNNFYYPFGKEPFLVLAFRLQLGSLAGASLDDIPFNKRFLGGSDDDLRGYRYKTVSSDVNDEGDPKGGRSAIFFTFEPRFRITETIGIVPFTDLGVVGQTCYPDPLDKWFKSVGIGLRYFTFFGPIRADIAFPLDKRSIDPRFRIYVSIGQTF